MAHASQRRYVQEVKQRFPKFFERSRVLDAGSLDINGNNRDFFTACDYTGVDLGPGSNVDEISLMHEFSAPAESFDVVISTEMLEHDHHYPESIARMVDLLRPRGLMVITCATEGRSPHGTRMAAPSDSPFTSAMVDWCDYYRNLTEEDIRAVVNVDGTFLDYEFNVDSGHCDLRFWGIKKNPSVGKYQ